MLFKFYWQLTAKMLIRPYAVLHSNLQTFTKNRFSHVSPPAAAANVTNKEIDDRLARLKGMEPSRYNASNKPVSGQHFHIKAFEYQPI